MIFFYYVFFFCILNCSALLARVAVVREEGSNGDREMSVSLYMAGFEVINNSFMNQISAHLNLNCVACVHY